MVGTRRSEPTRGQLRSPLLNHTTDQGKHLRTDLAWSQGIPGLSFAPLPQPIVNKRSESHLFRLSFFSQYQT